MLNKNQRTNADISALLRARNTLLWVVTREEQRVESAIITAAGSAAYETAIWDVAQGLQSITGEIMDRQLRDPSSMLDYVRERPGRRVYVLRDFHAFVKDPIVQRQLRTLARFLQSQPKGAMRAIVVLSPSSDVPAELADHATVIDYPLPERDEIAAVLGEIAALQPNALPADDPTVRDAAIDAAIGLTIEGAASCYAKSIVTCGRIDPVGVSQEKKRVISGIPGVTWYDPDPRGLDAVGGLENLKPWLRTRKLAFSQAARKFGLPSPRGVLLVGVPGCGKSLTAKAVAAAWGVPLLRLDLGALRSKYVGESEGNIRRALGIAETVAPCVLWLDEIEKALAGATGEAGDGGVAADAFGAVLSWMQEKTAPVVVIATANDVSKLPPELLRKGRFDELFFVDLPTTTERIEIARVSLRAYGRDPETVDVMAIAAATRDFTGSEIAALVPDALFAAFGDGERDITTADLLTAARSVVPLAQTAADKIGALREWAKTRARPASLPEQAQASQRRALDL